MITPEQSISAYRSPVQVIMPSRELLALADKEPYYIFSVFPYERVFMRNDVPGFGTVIIPHAKGRTVSEPFKIPNVVFSQYDAGNRTILSHNDAGLAIARQAIMHVGVNDARDDWSNWGIFVTTNEVPTEAEITLAKSKLNRNFVEYLKEADVLHRENRYKEIIDEHLWAADYLMQIRPWSKALAHNIPCPVCGEPILPDTIKHATPNCGAILDMEKAKKYGLYTEPAAPAPVRPRA